MRQACSFEATPCRASGVYDILLCTVNKFKHTPTGNHKYNTDRRCFTCPRLYDGDGIAHQVLRS